MAENSDTIDPGGPGPSPDPAPVNEPDASATGPDHTSGTETVAPDPEPPAPPARTQGSAWRVLQRSMRPRVTWGQMLTGVLCAVLGFAVVVQVQMSRTDGLSGLRQDELVRVLDDVTRRTAELQEQVTSLRAQRTALVTGSDTDRAAREAAASRAEVQGILAGQLPAQGPGIELMIGQPAEQVPAAVLYNVLEELRNAGAEVVQIENVRLVASSYFLDGEGGVVVDGIQLSPPYRWLVIGDPDTISIALNIPGGALATVRNAGGTTSMITHDLLAIDAVRPLEPPRYATPSPAETG